MFFLGAKVQLCYYKHTSNVGAHKNSRTPTKEKLNGPVPKQLTLESLKNYFFPQRIILPTSWSSRAEQ